MDGAKRLPYNIALAKIGRKCDQGLGAANEHCASHRYPFSHSFTFLSFPKKTLSFLSLFIYIFFSFLLTLPSPRRLSTSGRHGCQCRTFC